MSSSTEVGRSASTGKGGHDHVKNSSRLSFRLRTRKTGCRVCRGRRKWNAYRNRCQRRSSGRCLGEACISGCDHFRRTDLHGLPELAIQEIRGCFIQSLVHEGLAGQGFRGFHRECESQRRQASIANQSTNPCFSAWRDLGQLGYAAEQLELSDPQ